MYYLAYGWKSRLRTASDRSFVLTVVSNRQQQQWQFWRYHMRMRAKRRPGAVPGHGSNSEENQCKLKNTPLYYSLPNSNNRLMINYISTFYYRCLNLCKLLLNYSRLINSCSLFMVRTFYRVLHVWITSNSNDLELGKILLLRFFFL